ncbi:MAG TPA: FKBP-type peptidyl-prolyl cis-trans isomerase [Solirubrobacterales bacterium]
MTLQAAGCGGSAEGGNPTTTTASERAKTPTTADDKQSDWAPIEKAAGKKANLLLIPHGPPPKKVVFKDLQVGDGPVLKHEDWFTADYVAQNYETAEVRESYWGPPRTVFIYGDKTMVDGWIPGLKGMRIGGKRELILPASQAYGNPLVYVVKLVKLEPH